MNSISEPSDPYQSARDLLEADWDEPVEDWLWRKISDRVKDDFLDNYDPNDPEPAIHDLGVAASAVADTQKRGKVTGEVNPARADDYRWLALGEVAALDAVRQPKVEEFRREVLRDRLKDPAKAPAWLRRHRTMENKAASERPSEVLAYLVPGDPWVHRFPIQAGGVLDELRRLGVQLGRRYGWPEAWGVHFVLTGEQPPIVNPMRYTHHIGKAFPGLDLIDLHVSPYSDPKDVGRLFMAARERYLEETPTRKKKVHRLGEERAAMALHRYRYRDLSHREIRDKWNEEHPEWRSVPGDNFHRDLDDAYQELTGLPPPKGEKE